ncbi:ABC transporter permease [Streptomyces longispororuber]|uniref:ABC transporter permease n=1 Tax=Streptomyces longispororuber TaxID=68230 RepID=UPI002109B6EE|nr:ABC transporter permease [Streptomyces longispororuber]MCQ4207541.1 ABC transporter permease [Streptomyces longispororuber]
MFLALLELRAARGRFLLMGSVVVLVAALVGVVSGFTTGLGDDTVSALRQLPATHLAFAADAKSDQFARSLLPATALKSWQEADDVDATPLGVSITRGTTDRGVDVDLAAFGVEPGQFLDPGATTGHPLRATGAGIVISQQLHDTGVRVGDTLTIDRVGIRLQVLGTTDCSSYGHVPVAYLPLDVWRQIRFTMPGAAPDARTTLPNEYSAIALKAGSDADLAAADRTLGTHTLPVRDAYAAAPGYSGERVTMTSIQAFLYVIAPLVVGAFFAVWTVQRRPELALLRAMGASRRRLLGHTLAQAAVVVATGTVVGAALAAGVGALVGSEVPFSLPASVLMTTMATVILVGLAGAAITLRKIATVDPMTLLGAAR